jgi:hypothetical protein
VITLAGIRKEKPTAAGPNPLRMYRSAACPSPEKLVGPQTRTARGRTERPRERVPRMVTLTASVPSGFVRSIVRVRSSSCSATVDSVNCESLPSPQA